MSSILKALQKLENESPPNGDTKSWPVDLNIKKTVQKQVRGNWLARRIIPGISVFLIIMAIGWIFMKRPSFIFRPQVSGEKTDLSQRSLLKPDGVKKRNSSLRTPATNKPVVASKGRIKKSSPVLAGVKNKTGRNPAAPKPAQVKNYKKALYPNPEKPVIKDSSGSVSNKNYAKKKPQKIPAAMPHKPSGRINTAKKPLPVILSPEKTKITKKKLPVIAFNKKIKNPAKKASFKIADNKAKNAVKKQPAKIVHTSPKKSKNTIGHNKFPKISDKSIRKKEPVVVHPGENPAVLEAWRRTPVKPGEEMGLEIQALVWSPDPEGRLAVINGNIIRTNEKINGMTISYIGDNFVIVRKGNSKWKLNFTIQ